jgi:hypothetical protein
MNTYLVTWTEQIIMGVNIEAESEEGALNKWYQSDYDSMTANALDSEGVVDNSIIVELV